MTHGLSASSITGDFAGICTSGITNTGTHSGRTGARTLLSQPLLHLATDLALDAWTGDLLPDDLYAS